MTRQENIFGQLSICRRQTPRRSYETRSANLERVPSSFSGSGPGVREAQTSSTPSTRRGTPSGLLSCSSAGSTDSGASWKVSGRRNRRMAVAPTEVCTEVVAGQGPPWCCDQVTATPVGQPPNSSRPTRGASSAVSSRTSSPSAAWMVPVRLPSTAASAVASSSAEAVAHQQGDRTEALGQQGLGIGGHLGGRGGQHQRRRRLRVGGRPGAGDQLDGLVLGQLAEILPEAARRCAGSAAARRCPTHGLGDLRLETGTLRARTPPRAWCRTARRPG